MPTYCYEHLNVSIKCLEFEIIQSIKAEALTICPTCQKPCKRVIQVPNLPRVSKSHTADKAKQLGFQTFKRKSKGEYERA